MEGTRGRVHQLRVSRRKLLLGGGALALGLSVGDVVSAYASGAPRGTAATFKADTNSVGGIMRMGGPAINIRNFNPFTASPMTGTTVGMYEPLMIYNYVTKEIVPWLATGYSWSEGNLKLTFKIRGGVRWSDGRPFTARDVAFTFQMMKRFPGLLGSASGVWDTYLDSVSAVGDSAVFGFKQEYTPGLYDLMHQLIVPEHGWSSVSNPVTFQNPHPVSTGPLTRIESFNSEHMLLLSNQNYWQPGRPHIKGQRITAMAGNEQRLQALITNQLDWGGGYIPNIGKVYVDKDRAHHHFWWPLSGMVDLVVNHTKPPFDNLKVRQAISLAMDREAMVQTALQGHSKVADITNLPVYPYSDWIDAGIVKQYKWLMTRNVDRANRLLEEAGLKMGSGGIRTLSDGSKLRFQITVPTGWTDFISDCEVITNNCRDIGIDLTIYTPAVDTWYNNVYPGNFDMCLGDPGGFGATPFEAYRGYLSSQTYAAVGTQAEQNWQRYKNAEADSILDQFAKTASLTEQKALAVRLERIFAENLPVIPLYYEPEWGAYNTLYFTDFPSPPHPYAPLSDVSAFPTYNIVLNHIRPRG